LPAALDSLRTGGARQRKSGRPESVPDKLMGFLLSLGILIVSTILFIATIAASAAIANAEAAFGNWATPLAWIAFAIGLVALVAALRFLARLSQRTVD